MTEDSNPSQVPHGPLPMGSGQETCSRIEPPPTFLYGAVALGAFLALGPELWITFGLWFAPGWANSRGLTIQWVWPAGLTVCLCLLMITFGTGVGAALGFAMSLSRQKHHAGSVVVVWRIFWAALKVLSCVLVYRDLHASAVEMFPNGYNP
jgi:hypothetical protein